MKSIVLKQDMILPVLKGEKTSIRFVIKDVPNYDDVRPIFTSKWKFIRSNGRCFDIRNPYKIGDILYVREPYRYATWCFGGGGVGLYDGYIYTCGEQELDPNEAMVSDWIPAIRMKESEARIFLRVTGIEIKRLQDITEQEAINEGIRIRIKESHFSHIEAFASMWNSSVKRDNLSKYSWESSPWVWAIRFEKAKLKVRRL